MENGHLLWIFPLRMVIFHSFLLVHQRVEIIFDSPGISEIPRLSCHVSHLTSFNSEVPGPRRVEAGWKAENMGKNLEK